MPGYVADERQPVKRQRRTIVSTGLPFVSMGSSGTSPLGARILEAIEAEGRTVNSTEVSLGMSRGHLGRITRGERASNTLDVDLFARMAKLLHVNFEWLVLGEGPMRRGGRAATNAEEAMRFARQSGAREDAVQAAWERNKDRDAEMTIWDWVNAINAEAMRLATVPRPEEVAAKKSAIARQKKRLQKLSSEPEVPAEEGPVEPKDRLRVVGHHR